MTWLLTHPITYQPLSSIRSCSGFLGLLHVRPGPHILWSEGPSPDVSWNPAVHDPTRKPHWHDLRSANKDSLSLWLLVFSWALSHDPVWFVITVSPSLRSLWQQQQWHHRRLHHQQRDHRELGSTFCSVLECGCLCSEHTQHLHQHRQWYQLIYEWAWKIFKICV